LLLEIDDRSDALAPQNAELQADTARIEPAWKVDVHVLATGG
jgi:hypothetical protein